jgi:hypothetical protein
MKKISLGTFLFFLFFIPILFGYILFLIPKANLIISPPPDDQHLNKIWKQAIGKRVICPPEDIGRYLIIRTRVSILDLENKTGEIIWKAMVPGNDRNCAIAFSENELFFTDENGVVQAIEISTGHTN